MFILESNYSAESFFLDERIESTENAEGSELGQGRLLPVGVGGGTQTPLQPPPTTASLSPSRRAITRLPLPNKTSSRFTVTVTLCQENFTVGLEVPTVNL